MATTASGGCSQPIIEQAGVDPITLSVSGSYDSYLWSTGETDPSIVVDRTLRAVVLGHGHQRRSLRRHCRDVGGSGNPGFLQWLRIRRHFRMVGISPLVHSPLTLNPIRPFHNPPQLSFYLRASHLVSECVQVFEEGESVLILKPD